MALLYDAELTPSKPELLTGWVPGQPWFAGDADARATVVGSYRFDDPDGEVGLETFLVRFGDGPVLQVPITYRDAPLDGPEPVTTMEHSVLGRRWVYDGPHDPAYVLALATAVLTGGTEAQLVRPDGTVLPSRGTVRGTGSALGPITVDPATIETRQDGPVSRISTADLEIELNRVVDPTDDGSAELQLVGSWSGQPDPVELVVVHRRA